MEACGPPPRPPRSSRLPRYARQIGDVFIVSDAEILGCKPCVRGTRLSVEPLLELPVSGATQADKPTQYPQLTTEGLAAAFRYAAAVFKGEHMWEWRIRMRPFGSRTIGLTRRQPGVRDDRSCAGEREARY